MPIKINDTKLKNKVITGILYGHFSEGVEAMGRVYMLRPICEIVQFMNWAALLPSSWNGQ